MWQSCVPGQHRGTCEAGTVPSILGEDSEAPSGAGIGPGHLGIRGGDEMETWAVPPAVWIV